MLRRRRHHTIHTDWGPIKIEYRSDLTPDHAYVINSNEVIRKVLGPSRLERLCRFLVGWKPYPSVWEQLGTVIPEGSDLIRLTNLTFKEINPGAVFISHRGGP